VIGDIVKVALVGLLFHGDVLEQPGADAVSVLSTDLNQLVVDINGVQFHIGVKKVDVPDLLSLAQNGAPVAFRDGFPLQVLDAFGKGFGVAHLVNGDELHVGGQRAVIQIIQGIMLAHILGDGVQFHGTGLVQGRNDLLAAGVARGRPPEGGGSVLGGDGGLFAFRVHVLLL
jgi:hypothetical protein